MNNINVVRTYFSLPTSMMSDPWCIVHNLHIEFELLWRCRSWDDSRRYNLWWGYSESHVNNNEQIIRFLKKESTYNASQNHSDCKCRVSSSILKPYSHSQCHNCCRMRWRHSTRINHSFRVPSLFLVPELLGNLYRDNPLAKSASMKW